jgi:hypothetical protein
MMPNKPLDASARHEKNLQEARRRDLLNKLQTEPPMTEDEIREWWIEYFGCTREEYKEKRKKEHE